MLEGGSIGNAVISGRFDMDPIGTDMGADGTLLSPMAAGNPYCGCIVGIGAIANGELLVDGRDRS
jgi:hypothetical protein